MALALLAPLLLGGCLLRDAPPGGDALPRLADTGEPDLHRLESRPIRELMGELETLVFDGIYDQLAADRERLRQAGRFAALAARMTAAVGGLPALYRELPPDPEVRRVFAHYTETLQRQAQQLQREVRQERADAARQTMVEMVATCNACHRRFRQPRP